MRRSSIIILFIIAAVLLCGFAERHPKTVKVLTAEIATDKNVYKLGETVKMTVKLTNNSSEAISTYFPSGQKYDLTVLCVKKLVRWKWSRGKMFTMAIQPLLLQPGKSISYAWTWDQKENGGRPVPPGTYYVVGEIMLPARVKTSEKEIRIK